MELKAVVISIKGQLWLSVTNIRIYMDFTFMGGGGGGARKRRQGSLEINKSSANDPIMDS
jgi:hypothetical protein